MPTNQPDDITRMFISPSSGAPFGEAPVSTGLWMTDDNQCVLGWIDCARLPASKTVLAELRGALQQRPAAAPLPGSGQACMHARGFSAERAVLLLHAAACSQGDVQQRTVQPHRRPAAQLVSWAAGDQTRVQLMRSSHAR